MRGYQGTRADPLSFRRSQGIGALKKKKYSVGGSQSWEEAWGWREALTDPLEGERAFPEHGEGSVHQLALELPQGPVAGEGDVLAPPGQQVRGHLRDRQSQGHPAAGHPRGGWTISSPHPRNGLGGYRLMQAGKAQNMRFAFSLPRTDKEVWGQM